MDKFILQGESPEERLRILRDMADAKEEYSYYKELSEGDRANRLENSQELSNEIIDLEEEKADVTESFNERIKEKKAANREYLTDLRRNSRHVKEDVYLIRDDESGKMLYYNTDGELVHSRPMQPSEKQYKIHKAV